MNLFIPKPRKPKRMTKRRAQILDFIRESVATKGFPPSIREIGASVGLSSSSTVHSHLIALEETGHLKRDPSRPRSMTVSGMEMRPRLAIAEQLLRDWAESWPDLPAKDLHDRTAAFLEGA